MHSFSCRILWGIQWCIFSFFFSWAKKFLSQNVEINIFHKVKFFTDSVLSIGILKQEIATVNCTECLHEAGGKTNTVFS